LHASDITYSSRILLGAVSILIGLALFLKRLNLDSISERIMVTGLYIAIIFIVNTTLINGFGIDKIPATTVKARIDENGIMLDSEAQRVENPMFELSSDPFSSETIIYRILVSIPSIGLNIGV